MATLRSKAIRAGGRWKLRKLLRRFMDVCNAIDYAHSRGVLHRDIKPGNIILGKHGETLVVDWGLAKAAGRRRARSGSRRADAGSVVGQRQRRDAARQYAGHAGVHEPRAGRGDLEATGAAKRRLQPGRNAVLPADRPAALSRATTLARCWRPCRRASFRVPASSIRRSTGRSRPSASRRCREGPRIATPRRGRWPTTSSGGWPTSRFRPGASPGPTTPAAGWAGIARL